MTTELAPGTRVQLPDDTTGVIVNMNGEVAQVRRDLGQRVQVDEAAYRFKELRPWDLPLIGDAIVKEGSRGILVGSHCATAVAIMSGTNPTFRGRLEPDGKLQVLPYLAPNTAAPALITLQSGKLRRGNSRGIDVKFWCYAQDVAIASDMEEYELFVPVWEVSE